MKRNFNKPQIAQIALNVRKHKKLFVTTEGQMFTVEADAEEAVRVKNMIIDEPNDYVGIITITEDMVSDAQLRAFGKDPEAFGKLFEGAKIPRIKSTNGKQFEKKREPVAAADAEAAASIAAALGSGEEKTEETNANEETKKKTGLFGGGK